MAREAVPAQVIEEHEPDGATVLRIIGELDMASRATVEPAVLKAVSGGGSIVLDLSELTFCDSSGIAMFIATEEGSRGAGAHLAVRHVRPNIRRVFEITRFDTVVHIVE